MKDIIRTITILLVFKCSIYSQTIQQIENCDSAIIKLSEKTEGSGPKGLARYGFSIKSKDDSIKSLAYPKMKNIPDSINDLREYFIILNNFQFYYQYYRNGIYGKEYFLKKANEFDWNLNDTIFLTNKNVKNTISVAAGYNSNQTAMYIVDANNNNDFSDDTLRTLLFNLFRLEDIIKYSHYVNIEYYDGLSVKKDKILFIANISDNKEGDLDLLFSFPETRYGKFIYNNINYLVCAESYNPTQAIYVLIDKPYFSSIGRDKEIAPNQYIKLDKDFYVYIPCSQNSDKIKIKKVDISNDIYNIQVTEATTGSLMQKLLAVSNQVGMYAPQVKGFNIFNDSIVSLRSLTGKYVFLDFWATSCIPCIMDIPYLEKVYERYSRSQFEIIGVILDHTNGKIKEFLNDKGVIWPNINMKASTTDMTGYKITYYPTSYLIGPDGRIIDANLRGNELLNKLELLNVKKINVP